MPVSKIKSQKIKKFFSEVSASSLSNLFMISLRPFSILLILPLVWVASAQHPTKSFEPPLLSRKEVFNKGEKIFYRVHYGFITAGEAEMRVFPDLYKLNNRISYKLEVAGKTTGAFDRVLRIRDTWGSYMDTATAKPHKSYRFIEEGRYRRLEEVYFDFVNKTAKVDWSLENKSFEVKIDDPVHDLVGGYFWLRMIDYDKLKPGEIITVNGHLEKDTYPLKVRYVGREKVKTQMGKIEAILLSPIMPKNSLFDGENSIKFYISADQNRVPVLIRAELFLGAIEVDIKGHQNLKFPIKFS